MRWRWVGGLVLATLLSAPSALATADSPAAPSSATTLTVTIGSLEPRVLSATGQLSVQGTVTAQSPASHLHLSLQTGTHLGSRGALHSAETEGVLGGLQLVGGIKEDVPGGRRVAPRRPATFRLQVPVADLHLAPDQVSPMRITVHGDDGASGQVDTFLPYFPNTLGAAPQVTLVLPLTSTPDSGEPGSLSPGELTRLSAAVAAAAASRPDSTHARPSSVAVAVDPAVLGRLTPAAPLLAAVRDLASVPGVTLQGLPYADSDLDALQAAGDTRSVAQRVSGAAQLVGTTLESTRVGSEPLLPPDGVLTGRTLASSGARSVVLDGVLPVDPTAAGTPSALTTVGRATPALVTDPVLQQQLVAADSGAPTPRMAEQLLLAETALIAAEAPNATPARALVLLAPRQWSASRAWATRIVQDLAGMPWLSPTPVAQLLTGVPVPRSAALPAVDARALPASGIRAGDKLRQQAATVGSLLRTRGPQEAQALVQSVDRSESAAWRTRPEIPERLREQVGATTASFLRGVVVDAGARQYLTGSSGSIPVTVTNSLRRDVTVVLTLTPGPGSRIDRSTRTVSLSASGDGRPQRIQVALKVTSRGAGRFPVTLTVTTREHQQLGKPIGIVVRSGNLGTVAVAITVTALAVLVVALLFRGTRGAVRLRRRRRAGPGRHRVPAGASS